MERLRHRLLCVKRRLQRHSLNFHLRGHHWEALVLGLLQPSSLDHNNSRRIHRSRNINSRRNRLLLAISRNIASSRFRPIVRLTRIPVSHLRQDTCLNNVALQHLLVNSFRHRARLG